MSHVSTTKVYYNSACPVCRAGIEYQRKKLAGGACAIDWIDVHRTNEAVADLDADLEYVRERLHVVDEQGNVHVGAEAFAELWSKAEGQRTLAKLARAPVVRVVCKWLYVAFAKLLYRWNKRRRRW